MTLELYLKIAAVCMALNLVVGCIAVASKPYNGDDWLNALIVGSAAVTIGLLWPLMVFWLPLYVAICIIRKFK